MIRVARYLFLLFILTLPYYLFGSGGIQISTIFLILSFIVGLAHCLLYVSERKRLTEIFAKNRHLIMFFFLAATINMIYTFVMRDSSLLMPNLYLIFNFIAVVLFFIVGADKRLLRSMKTCFRINIVLQLAIYFLGFGRDYSLDRYMGTFNDPNQFSFFILISLIFMYVIGVVTTPSKSDILFWGIGVVLVLLAASTGILLGMGVFLALLAALNYRKILLWVQFIVIFIFAAVGVLMLPLGPQKSTGSTHNEMLFFERISSKFDSIDAESDRTIFEDRVIDRVFYYPQYLLFGSGDGAHERFPKQYLYGLEIHSTPIALLFYYGIIPFLFIVYWVWRMVRNADIRIKIALIAILHESITLLNYRQPLMWMLVAFSSVAAQAVERNNLRTILNSKFFISRQRKYRLALGGRK